MPEKLEQIIGPGPVQPREDIWLLHTTKSALVVVLAVSQARIKL